MSTPTKTPAKIPAKKTAKPKAPVLHPKYSEMVVAAITALKERNGSSRIAIFKYISANYQVGDVDKKINKSLKLTLHNGVDSGLLKQTKGSGANGSFKVAKQEKKVIVKKSTPVTKTIVKKTPKKPVAKKIIKKSVTKEIKIKVTKPVRKVSPQKTPIKKIIKKKATAKKVIKKKQTKKVESKKSSE